eukprot:COSAG02_NODE_40755_length_401_cov_6.400662_1_plen_88_part_10
MATTTCAMTTWDYPLMPFRNGNYAFLDARNRAFQLPVAAFYMMESAGFENVVIEDRWWDEGDGEAKDTRRPGITAFNPRTRRWYVLDI